MVWTAPGWRSSDLGAASALARAARISPRAISTGTARSARGARHPPQVERLPSRLDRYHGLYACTPGSGYLALGVASIAVMSYSAYLGDPVVYELFLLATW